MKVYMNIYLYISQSKSSYGLYYYYYYYYSNVTLG
jgi:hypothetical protein